MDLKIRVDGLEKVQDLLARLEGAAAKGDDSAGKKAGYLSTHPATIERLVPLQGPACD